MLLVWCLIFLRPLDQTGVACLRDLCARDVYRTGALRPEEGRWWSGPLAYLWIHTQPQMHHVCMDIRDFLFFLSHKRTSTCPTRGMGLEGAQGCSTLLNQSPTLFRLRKGQRTELKWTSRGTVFTDSFMTRWERRRISGVWVLKFWHRHYLLCFTYIH